MNVKTHGTYRETNWLPALSRGPERPQAEGAGRKQGPAEPVEQGQAVLRRAPVTPALLGHVSHHALLSIPPRWVQS